MAYNGVFSPSKWPFGAKWPIFSSPYLRYPMRRSQMLVFHFDTCSNGVETMWKPKPNSWWIPYLLIFRKLFSNTHFSIAICGPFWTRVQGKGGPISRTGGRTKGANKLRNIFIRDGPDHIYSWPPKKAGVQRCGRLAITSPGGEDDPHVIDQSFWPSYEEENVLRRGR